MLVHGVFEGGGVRGIALAGAAAAALEHGLAFDRLAGTSAGALVAALVAAGYGPGELGDQVCQIDWPGLLDPVPGRRLPFVGPHLALLLHNGLYRGDALEATWARLLARKGVRTFDDLPAGKLRVVATDLSHQVGVLLPDALRGLGHDPGQFPVARAARISAAVPFIFQPVELADRVTGERVLLADGAMATNYPIRAVPRDRPVVGFRLRDERAAHPHLPVRGPASLARAVALAGIRARYALPQPAGDATLTVEVPVDRDLDFDVAPGRARAVFERGRGAAAAQLAAELTSLRPSSPGSTPVER